MITETLETKSLFSDALRQSERRTWELWDAVRTAASEIANAKRAEKVTGTKVDVAAKADEMVSFYAAEVKSAMIEQSNENAESENLEPFYQKLQPMDTLLIKIEEHYAPTTPYVRSSTTERSDSFAFRGGAVTALGGGKVGGYLV